MNPILPREFFVPDVEARPMPDGRIYLYGSLDVSGDPGYCCKEMRCFSSDDMVNWRDEGVIFRNDGENSMFPAHPDTKLFAPDCIEKDGRYYLFVCCPGDFEGVAVADHPAGPFSDAVPVKGADEGGIDPSVFVDDDGTVYYFWGQFHLKGGILNEDLTALIPESVTDNIITEYEHGFHEGASIRKRNGVYYMVYTDISRGRATCMSYATADHPLGPYTKRGVIIDNYGCDPNSWNDHGSICCYKDQWYVFYHRSSQNCGGCRRACVEPIFFDENGLIPEVKQSSNGAEKPLDVTKGVDASVASRLSAKSYIAPSEDGECIFLNRSFMEGWAEYRGLDFGNGVSKMTIRIKGKGTLTVKTESTLLGQTDFDAPEFTEITFDLAPIADVHPLWLLADQNGVEVDWFVIR